MHTARTSRTRPTAAPTVVDLRPRVAARRAAALRARLMERREQEPQYRGAIAIIRDVLDRCARVPPTERDSWDRLLTLLEEHEDAPHTTSACAAAANLVGLALFGDPIDNAALADLADELGHERLARMQHRYGSPLEPNPGLPLTTDAVRRMLAKDLRERLAAHPETAGRVESIDDACLRAAHALLQQDMHRTWSVPALESVEELVDIAQRGTIVEWRHHLARVAANAWSPYTAQLVELAAGAGHTHTATVIAAIVDLCRDDLAGSAYVAVPGARALGAGPAATGRTAIGPGRSLEAGGR